MYVCFEGSTVSVAATGRGAEDDGNAFGAEAGDGGMDGVVYLAKRLPEQAVVVGMVFRRQVSGQRLPVMRGAATNGETAPRQPVVFIGERLCGGIIEGRECSGAAVAEGADEAGVMQMDHGVSGSMCQSPAAVLRR